MELLTAIVVAKLKARLAATATRVAAALVVLLTFALGFGMLLFGGAAAGTAATNSSTANLVTTCASNFSSSLAANAGTTTPLTSPSNSPATASGDAAGASTPSLGGVPMTTEQLANAAVIVATGRQLNVPMLGLETALITAITESGLRNLSYGDLDSVGLFQQRPSAGWGSVAQIMQPDYAATRFYQALVAIPNYQQLTAPTLAQAVQRSAFPDRYANWLQVADQLLGIPSIGSASCIQLASQAGAVFGTGADATVLPKGNPRTVDQAIAWAELQASNGSSNWYRSCLGFVAQAYGWGFSGTNYAIDQYTSVIPVSMHHDGDRNPPPGALLFWQTAGRAGHVAIYLGNGNIASTDILVNGHIGIVPASLVEEKWGSTYVGWAPPYFPGGG